MSQSEAPYWVDPVERYRLAGHSLPSGPGSPFGAAPAIENVTVSELLLDKEPYSCVAAVAPEALVGTVTHTVPPEIR